MKKIVKNTTVAAMAGVMAIGMLSGCGSKGIDGEKTVAFVYLYDDLDGDVEVSDIVKFK